MKKTKYIFVTGGVVSSLGKGIIAASLGKLLQARGFKVTIQKLDPYINIDPGTLNPYEHGECYVTVDGQETALPTIETAKFDEVQKYLTTTHHVYDPLVVLFSKKTWDKLSADERQILTDAAKEATPYQRELNRQREVEMLKAVQAKGMVVTEMSKEERARMRQHLQPVTDKYTQEVGADLVKEIFAEIDKARAQLAAK